MTTLPSFSSSLASSRPMPLVPPVTRIVLPFMFMTAPLGLLALRRQGFDQLLSISSFEV